MRSFQIPAWGEPLVERQLPTPVPQGSEVLLKVDVCGVCHSDLHIWDGFFDLGGGQKATLESRGVDLPFTMGHEIVGEVAAMGPDATGVAIGDKRVAYPWIGCGECALCRAGDDIMCNTQQYLGTRVPGGYSDHVMVPHPRYLLSFDGIPPALACTYACSGLTAYSALLKAGDLTAQDHLLIIGAGGVGLSAVHIAKALTPAAIIVADIDPEKRAAADAAGVSLTIDNAEPEAVRQLIKLTKGGPKASLDFVGAPATTKFGIDTLAKGGTHVIVGLFGGALSLSLPLFPFKQMTVRGSFTGTRDELIALLDLARTGRIPEIPIETHALDRANETLEDLKAGRIIGRAVLTP
ncbi:MAG: alcohol dehydrogenase [Alphaproteobacteria bacterium]